MTEGHDYPIMHLTEDDVTQLREFTEKCKQNKNVHKVVDRKYTKGATEKGVIMMGKAGEVIVSRYYDRPIDWDIYIGPDKGHDIQINNKTTEIKTSNGRNLIINDPQYCDYGLWKSGTEQCVIVWCNQPKEQWELIDTKTKFQIVGGTSRENFFANAHSANYGYGPRLVLNEHELNKLMP